MSGSAAPPKLPAPARSRPPPPRSFRLPRRVSKRDDFVRHQVSFETASADLDVSHRWGAAALLAFLAEGLLGGAMGLAERCGRERHGGCDEVSSLGGGRTRGLQDSVIAGDAHRLVADEGAAGQRGIRLR